MKNDIKIDDFTGNYQLFIPAILSFIGVGVCLFFMYRSAQNLFETIETIEKVEVEIDSETNKLDKLKELENGELAQVLNQVNTALPDEVPIFEAIAAINESSNKSNIIITELLSSPGSIATPSARIVANPRSSSNSRNVDYETVSIVMTMSGSVSDLNDFLKSLLTVAPLMELKTVRVSSSDINQTRSEIELSVYWKPSTSVRSNSTTPKTVATFSDKEVDLIEEVTSLESF